MVAPTKCPLLLVSYEFPFGRAETFLESELPILCRHFASVSILPSRLVWSPGAIDRSRRRALPANAAVVGEDRIPGLAARALPDVLAMRARARAGGRADGSFLARQKWAGHTCLKAGVLTYVLRRLGRQWGAIPFVYSYWNTEAAEAAALLSQRRQVPGFITRCHGIDLYVERLTVPVRPLERLTRSTVRAYVPISMHGLDYLAGRGVAKDKLHLSRLGVLPALGRSRASQDGVFRLVSCSGLIPLKRVELLAEALVGLDVPFEWTHLGDGRRRAAVEEIVARFPAHGRARLGGSRPNAEVLAFYRENPVDVFVNASDAEGVPVSIMEVLAHGIPCLATQVGGTGEIVDDSCGELLPAELTAPLLRERLRAVADPALGWAGRREGAYRRWAERCDAERNFTDFATWLAIEAARSGTNS